MPEIFVSMATVARLKPFVKTVLNASSGLYFTLYDDGETDLYIESVPF